MKNFELSYMVAQCNSLLEVKKNQLKAGDHIILKTYNSTYKIMVDTDGKYIVSGGWFDKNNMSPLKTTINGCTWGGSVIKTDIIAACGLFLEFGNKLKTSRIKEIFIFPTPCQN
jgi:hypothetical protein